MTRKKIFAAYARISNEEEYGNGLSSQLKGVRNYIRDIDGVLPEEYTFQETHTGTLLERPKLNEIKILMRAGKIDGVVVYDASRLARKVSTADLLLDLFEETGVELHIVSWDRAVNPKKARDRQSFNNESVQSDTERRNILERTKRGKLDLLSDCIPTAEGRWPFGYRIEGRKRNKRYVQVPEQVEVVRLIFNLYVVEGFKIPDIVKYLNVQGYPTPSQTNNMNQFNHAWSRKRVYDILKNSLYTGRYQWGKTKTIGHATDENGKRKAITRECKEVPVSFELEGVRIIDDEMFNYVQERIANGRTIHANEPKHEYLIARRLRCACGYKTQATCMLPHYRYYICRGQKDKIVPDCPIPIRLPAAKVDPLIWAELEAFIRNPQWELEKLQAAQQRQQTTNVDIASILGQLDKKRKEYQTRLATLYEDFRFKACIPEQVYEQLKAPVERLLEEAEEQYREYQNRMAERVLSDQDIAAICTECANIAELLDQVIAHEGGLAFKHKRRVVELLDVQIKLEADTKGVKFHITIHGEDLTNVILGFSGSVSLFKDKGYPKQ